MDVNLFDFDLPLELIAQKPALKRQNARLLVLNKENESIVDEHFFDITKYFKSGDVLVLNNTKVIPARLRGIKVPTGARIEVILLKALVNDEYEVLIGNAKAVKVGTKVSFGNGLLLMECLTKKDEGIHIVKFYYEGIFLEVLEKVGTTPLPPYIKDDSAKYARYQTVFAKIPGSAAAPTAGFHFTPEILSELKANSVIVAEITLHIGLGTFKPVGVSDTKDHVMHYETYEIKEDVANILNLALAENRRIISVGTTATRTLEANFLKYQKIVATQEATNLFITPGYKYNVISALITNFHLPKSTLIMLVSAFANREYILRAYAHAINEKYRFFSFGDVMYIYGKDKLL